MFVTILRETYPNLVSIESNQIVPHWIDLDE
jgi:hypothetical protein